MTDVIAYRTIGDPKTLLDYGQRSFLGNVSPPDVEALIRKHVSPIRPGRSRPRKMTVKHAVSFIYRVA